MQNSMNIIFYSNHSQSCQSFFNLLKKNNILLADLMFIKFICVDNIEIKKKLITSTNIKIDKVPTLLVINNDKSVSKFVDSNFFNWVKKVINDENTKNEAKNQKDEQIAELNKELENCGIQSNELITTIKTYEEFVKELELKKNELEEQIESLEGKFEKEEQKNLERAMNYNKKVAFNLEKNETVINDDELTEIPRKSGTLRMDEMNFENNVDFGTPEEENRDVSHKLESKDVLAIAEAMQKDRDPE
jgi:hypothetical protein